jgi:hypothetical protein
MICKWCDINYLCQWLIKFNAKPTHCQNEDEITSKYQSLASVDRWCCKNVTLIGEQKRECCLRYGVTSKKNLIISSYKTHIIPMPWEINAN